ncbi:putative sugar-phosphate nucleotidyl transferase [Bordetella tumbae]|uniref:N-acetylmuramate alpha-1-phosphate uridylyltransferase MurU n=1 Tax=Bordetella tumbae TaxID=1649139 RepID=UPI0039EF5726
MRAMILAAGRGERMRPLTDHTPKPLLPAGGKPLIVWHLERLAAVGIREIVINHAWLGEQLPAQLGDGSRFGVQIAYSPESPAALETAGGIAQALPLLGSDPFLVVNGDIWCDWNPAEAEARLRDMHRAGADAWLLLVDNPEHHPQGDFILSAQGIVLSDRPQATNSSDGDANTSTLPKLTFAGIGLYRPALFADLPPAMPAPLGPLLRAAMARDAVLGTHHRGAWTDVGTPQRLETLDALLKSRQRQ